MIYDKRFAGEACNLLLIPIEIARSVISIVGSLEDEK